jgi:hypothetical protein
MESTRKKHRASTSQLLPTGILALEDFEKGTNFRQITKEKRMKEAENFYGSKTLPKNHAWLESEYSERGNS